MLNIIKTKTWFRNYNSYFIDISLASQIQESL